MKQLEIKKNITDIIKQYSLSTNIPPQFIEKDYFVVKVLAALENIIYSDAKIVFTGGTCLSKAYGKIKRFSEDIDFCVHTSTPFSRKDKSNFRKFIISELNKCEDFKVIDSPITITDENNFFSFEIEYDKSFEATSNLRKNIKVEFKFENLQLKTNKFCIESFIHPFINDNIANVECINLIELVANKYSAFLWRTHIKDRTKPLYSKENDPTIMRHLYDISTLADSIKTPEFKELAENFFKNDSGRGNIDNNYSITEFSKLILNKIKNDNLFKKEYTDFVDSMCYSTEKISYEAALEKFKNIIEYFTA